MHACKQDKNYTGVTISLETHLHSAPCLCVHPPAEFPCQWPFLSFICWWWQGSDLALWQFDSLTFPSSGVPAASSCLGNAGFRLCRPASVRLWIFLSAPQFPCGRTLPKVVCHLIFLVVFSASFSSIHSSIHSGRAACVPSEISSDMVTVCSYLLDFEDQHTLPKWNILSQSCYCCLFVICSGLSGPAHPPTPSQSKIKRYTKHLHF